ncbi:hypothetical protein D9756_011075 [Leucocoprinus leucothites]|uniref:Uncharacterized protein n=1 Tax=Leucocoprinus leucothites TaxID=201217 RepID=A0A8H5CMU6_9AGAR|nr:hypothetical protein D9756_011075 [Leucoagaricus leucothites]
MATKNRWVVVDDIDPKISYSGAWLPDNNGSGANPGNFGPPYLGTLHGISTNGSVSFPFNGTSIEVLGTNSVVNFDTNPDPNWECFIDGISIGRDNLFEWAESNWRFCGRHDFADGNHTLRIEVTVQSPNHTFWLDQIRYIPSPTLPLDNKTILIENTDPAVQFDTQWGSLAENANITTKQGSVARVTFIGTSISWYAYIPTEWPHNRSQGSWSMDGGEEITFSLEGLPADAKTTVYNQKFFTTPEFPVGTHNLVVTFHGSNQTTPLCLDYLYVKNGSFPTSSSPSSSGLDPGFKNTSTSTPGPQSSDIDDGGTSGGVPESTAQLLLPSPSPSSTLDSGGLSGGVPVGTIVGGVMGGLAVLLCLAGVFIFIRHRRLKGEFSVPHGSKYTTPTRFPFYYRGERHRRTVVSPGAMIQTEPRIIFTQEVALGDTDIKRATKGSLVKAKTGK